MKFITSLFQLFCKIPNLMIFKLKRIGNPLIFKKNHSPFHITWTSWHSQNRCSILSDCILQKSHKFVLDNFIFNRCYLLELFALNIYKNQPTVFIHYTLYKIPMDIYRNSFWVFYRLCEGNYK
jgi:hypothetical protein